MPEINIVRDYSYVDDLTRVDFDRFSSTDNIKNEEYLTRLLKKGGFLK